MAKNNMWQILGVIVIAYVLLNGGIGGGDSTGDTGGSTGDTGGTSGSCVDSSATVAFSAVNKLSQSTSVSPTITVKENNGVPATNKTSYPVGANLEILWSASNYIDEMSTYTVPCGGGSIPKELYATDDGAFRIYNSDGDALTDNAVGGATNQSLLGTGGNKNLKIIIDGNDKQSLGDLVVVVEHTNTTGCDKITLSGLGGATQTDVPGFYATAASGSKAYAYDVPAVVGAQSVEGTLGLKAKSSQTCFGAVYVTAYSKQAFQDLDGTFKKGVEDMDDTVKYEDEWDFDFYVDAA